MRAAGSRRPVPLRPVVLEQLKVSCRAGIPRTTDSQSSNDPEERLTTAPGRTYFSSVRTSVIAIG
jgi:hypothetical protein